MCQKVILYCPAIQCLGKEMWLIHPSFRKVSFRSPVLQSFPLSATKPVTSRTSRKPRQQASPGSPHDRTVIRRDRKKKVNTRAHPSILLGTRILHPPPYSHPKVFTFLLQWNNASKSHWNWLFPIGFLYPQDLSLTPWRVLFSFFTYSHPLVSLATE